MPRDGWWAELGVTTEGWRSRKGDFCAVNVLAGKRGRCQAITSVSFALGFPPQCFLKILWMQNLIWEPFRLFFFVLFITTYQTQRLSTLRLFKCLLSSECEHRCNHFSVACLEAGQFFFYPCGVKQWWERKYLECYCQLRRAYPFWICGIMLIPCTNRLLNYIPVNVKQTGTFAPYLT